MAYEKLVLHPLNARAILHDPWMLVAGLVEKGLIGGSFSWDGEVHYAAGPRFRKLVLFKRTQEPDRPAPHVSISETTAEPEFLGASHARPPRCPWCRGTFGDWKSHLRSWQQDRSCGHWSCTRCRRPVEIERLNWDHTGGIARYALDLWEIRQNAAVPSNELLAFLEETTLERWSYFYYQLGTEPPRWIQPVTGGYRVLPRP